MGNDGLRDFVTLLERRGELVRVTAPVSPALEITEIVRRVSQGQAARNSALLFEQVVGYDVPVLINMFGSAQRMAWALHVDTLEDLNRKLAQLVDLRLPRTAGAAAGRALGLVNALRAAGIRPRKVKRAPVQEIVETDNPSLDFLPILTCWPNDGGPFITLPQVVTQHPETGVRNVGMYRLQKVDSRTLLVHWQRHKGGAEHERAKREGETRGQGDKETRRGGDSALSPQSSALSPQPSALSPQSSVLSPHSSLLSPQSSVLSPHSSLLTPHSPLLTRNSHLPAAVVLGGDPACIWCASAPLPPDIDEYLLAGWLRGKPVPMVDCVTQPLSVPADADVVIEGYVDLDDRRHEGPFGDHTGYYTPVELFPAFHVTAVTRRREPVYPATVVGPPPMEDYWMGKATERLFLPLLRLFLPEVVDFAMPAPGVFHNLVLVSIQKRFPGHARKVIHGLWGLALLSLAKCLVVVDAWVDVQNPTEAAWQALGNVDWARDVLIAEGPVDHLDHASYQHSFGGKIGIDATAKWPEEGYARGWPEVARMSPEVQARVDALWAELGLGHL